MKRILSLISALALSVTAFALPYDDGLQRSTPEEQGVSSEAVAKVFQALDEGGYNVHSLMILRHGKVIAEHWWHPFRPEYSHAMYSSTKTFTAIAIGMAVDEGLLSIDEKVMDFFPDLLPETLPEGLEELSVEHLLTMSAGHASTSYPGSGESQIRAFLATPYAHKPGTAFAYNITCSHVLSHILFRRSGLTLLEFLQPRLFDKLGIEDVVWEMDLDGKNMGNGGMHAKVSDLAKLGLFLSRGGNWNGEQLVSSEWVKSMTTPHIYQHPDRSPEENAGDDGAQGYGYQTWMGRHGSYRAIGGSNQLALVIPEADLVIASQGEIRDENGFNSIMYSLIDACSNKKLRKSKFDLAAAIEGYELKRPLERSSCKLTSRTLRYKIFQNSYGISDIALRFDAEGNCTLTMEEAAAVHNIPFGIDDWKIGSTDRRIAFQGMVYLNTMDTSPVRTAGICSWTNPSELLLHYFSMFNIGAAENFQLKFSGCGEDPYAGLEFIIKGRQSNITLKGSRER